MADITSEIAPRTPAPPADGLLASTRGARLDVSATTTIRGGRFPAGCLDDYVYIPVAVPEGVGELQVTCDYGPDEDNFLNIGIFGPEGHELGNDAGFRGWSHGGRRGRRRLLISESRATPGYLAGPITAGTWHIALNPHSIGSDGLDWTLVVTMGISGALAGLAGSDEILGVSHYMPSSFSVGYGFDSIRGGTAATSTSTPSTPTVSRHRPR